MARIELPVNLEDVEASGTFELIPSAIYSMEIENIKEKTSASENQYLEVTLKVIDDEEFNGRKLWDNVSLQAQALFKLKQMAISAGIEISEAFDTEDLLGLVVLGVVDAEASNKTDEETGEPIMRNVIKGYKPQE